MGAAVLKSFPDAAEVLHKHRAAAQGSPDPVAVLREILGDTEQGPDMAEPVLLEPEGLVVGKGASPICTSYLVHLIPMCWPSPAKPERLSSLDEVHNRAGRIMPIRRTDVGGAHGLEFGMRRHEVQDRVLHPVLA